MDRYRAGDPRKYLLHWLLSIRNAVNLQRELWQPPLAGSQIVLTIELARLYYRHTQRAIRGNRARRQSPIDWIVPFPYTPTSRLSSADFFQAAAGIRHLTTGHNFHYRLSFGGLNPPECSRNPRVEHRSTESRALPLSNRPPARCSLNPPNWPPTHPRRRFRVPDRAGRPRRAPFFGIPVDNRLGVGG